VNIARVLMVGAHRIGSACLSLQFDCNLTKFDKTYVVCPLPGDRLQKVFEKYNIDTGGFEYVNDYDLVAQNPELSHWHFADDTRGSWLLQQAIKFLMLDKIDADVVFIHDSDTFCIQPYHCVVDGKLNLFVNNVTHPKEYYQVFENITGLPRQHDSSFIADMMPVFKSDWNVLKTLITNKFEHHWLDVLIEETPWNYTENLKWFSEYEFLGNWATSQHDQYQLTEQNRYEYAFLEILMSGNFSSDVACLIDRNKQGRIFPFNYGTNTVMNLDIVIDRFQQLGILLK